MQDAKAVYSEPNKAPAETFGAFLLLLQFKTKKVMAGNKKVPKMENPPNPPKKNTDHQFKEGNKMWQLAENAGRKKKFQTPEILREEINKYFKHIIENPFKETVVSAGKKVSVDKKRPFTIKGLCVYIGITHETFLQYEKRDEYTELLTCTREIIYTQKFEGAAAGFFNSSIIARDLGLIDRKDHTTKGAKLGQSVSVKVVRKRKK